jgi:hypothetical protein
VAVGMSVGVSVGTGVAVSMSVGVSVGTGVAVGVSVGTGVAVGMSVGVSVGTGVAVGMSVGVSVGTGVAVGVSVGAGVAVGVSVGTVAVQGLGGVLLLCGADLPCEICPIVLAVGAAPAAAQGCLGVRQQGGWCPLRFVGLSVADKIPPQHRPLSAALCRCQTTTQTQQPDPAGATLHPLHPCSAGSADTNTPGLTVLPTPPPPSRSNLLSPPPPPSHPNAILPS